MPEQQPRSSRSGTSTVATQRHRDPVAAACHRHLTALAQVHASIDCLPGRRPATALPPLLLEILEAMHSGERLAQALHNAEPPSVQAPPLQPAPLTQATTSRRRGLVTWAQSHGWDSRYLAPADAQTLDPLETVVHDAAQDLAELAAAIDDIQQRWQRYQRDERHSPDWLADVAFFHVASPWRRQLPRLWGLVRALQGTVDSDR